MAGEWQRHEVSQLMEDGKLVIGDGYRAKNDELASSGLPFARASNINDGFRFDNADHFPEENLVRAGSKISRPGDVVFTSKGTVGRFAFVRPTTARFVYSPQLCFWRSLDHARIYPRFLYYWMLGREFFVQFKGVAGQTDMAEYVSLTDQRRMYITLPPLPEQRAIAHILGTLDDKIELNRRMNEALEAMARALFKSWFVDFDPVRAKCRGDLYGRPELGSHKGCPYITSEILALFPARLVDSEFGEIPEGWEVESIADFASLNPETWSKDTRPDVINYVDLSNTKWGRIETITAYAQQDAPSRAQRVLRPLSVEYAEFVYLAATAAENIEALAHLADGGAYPAVRPEVVAATPVVRPDDKALSRFSRTADPLLAKMAHNEHESRTLAAVRDTLLPKLISGELQVKGAAGFLEGVGA